MSLRRRIAWRRLFRGAARFDGGLEAGQGLPPGSRSSIAQAQPPAAAGQHTVRNERASITIAVAVCGKGCMSGRPSAHPQAQTDEASRFDFGIFAVAVALTLLYNLQLLVPLLSSLFVRQAVIAVLYARLIVRSRSLTFGTPPTLLVFFGLSAVVMLHTAVSFDWRLAVLGFTRFINVVILAPPAIALVTSEARLRIVIVLWFAAIGLGLATDLYQVFGGHMAWLVQDYISGRCDLPRYKTILGEPNVGGMAAAIASIGAVLLFRRPWLRLAGAALSIVFVILSPSRAAFLIVAVGALAACALEAPRLRQAWQRPHAGRRAMVAVLAILAGGIAADQVPEIHAYVVTIAASFTGDCTGVSNDASDRGTYYGGLDGFFSALHDRAFDRVGQGLSLMETAAAAADTLVALLVSLFGLSFAVAGSVAVELRGSPPAFLPHNGFLEMFLVGGPVLLASFVVIVAQTGRRIFSFRRRWPSPMASFIVVGYAVLVLTTMGYPTFYHPVLGSLFWVIVAVAHRPEAWKPSSTASAIDAGAAESDPPSCEVPRNARVGAKRLKG
jgi:O-antigen ligase